MNIESTVEKTQKVKLSEEEVKNVLIAHIVEKYGTEWEKARISIWNKEIIHSVVGDVCGYELITEAVLVTKTPA